MNKPLTLVSLITLSLLAACSDKAEEKTGSINCNDPAVLQSARDGILQTVKQEARQYAQNDNRQYVDADKVIAAGSDLNITLNEVKNNSNGTSPACTAVLNIQIPEPILQAARDNQALVYYPQNLDGILQQRTGGNTGLSYDDNSGLFKQVLNYTPAPAQNGGVTVNYADNNLTSAGQTLTATLLPYGVKSILIMGGKPIPREEALKQLAIAASALSEAPAPSNQADPHDILENNSASVIFAPETGSSSPAPETLAPKPETTANISPAELDQARSNNQQADADINRAWERLDQTVQKELLSEQRDWIHSKNSNCRTAAARAGNTDEAEYLKLQCDTRMTRERIQYLKGYSIP